MFELLLILLLLVLIGLVIYLITLFSKPKSNDSMKLIQDHIFNMNRTLDKKLSESTDSITKTFETSSKISMNSNKAIEEITRKLTQIDETNKQIKDIGGQLDGLENILNNPKGRGNLGEYFLEQLLSSVFTPDQYKLQYSISDNFIVDAALFIGDKVIPVDSKFPKENYDKLLELDDEANIKIISKKLKIDIKNKIDETSKYIIPEKNTVDFAIMLVPAEGLYYDLFINKIGDINPKELIEYAFSKKVIISSPNSFYAYLQTIIQGMKAMHIEEKAKEIGVQVEKLSKHLQAYESHFQKLGNSLGTTVNHYNNSYKELNKIDKDVLKITDKKAGGKVDVLELDRPNL